VVMNKNIQRHLNMILVGLLTSAMNLSAEPVPRNSQDAAQTQASQAPHDAEKPPPIAAGSNSSELPDAPMPAQPAPREPSDTSQTQNPGSVPSGAAGAKVTHPKGAPAARPIGAAIAPVKQRTKRSLLIKVGLVAGACVAVGSVVALSRASPSKPAGAP
jgi:hypothetical protein